MGLIGGLWLFVLGALAAPSIILAKRPDADQILAKITPYQGWIGAVSALWGVWGIISSILNLGWLSIAPIYWITFFAVAIVQASLGLLLGIGILKSYIKSPAAQEKLDMTITKLRPKQGLLGLIGMGLGIWLIIAGFIFKVG